MACRSTQAACALRIAAAQDQLFQDHLEILERTKTLEGCRSLVIDWAGRSWIMVVFRILADLSRNEILHKTGLLKRMEDEAAQTAQSNDARTFLKLTLRAASQRAWSMSVWSELPPHSWSKLLSSDADKARDALESMQEEQEVVDQVLKLSQSPGPYPSKEAWWTHVLAFCCRESLDFSVHLLRCSHA